MGLSPARRRFYDPSTGPQACFYREILNTDSPNYGGSGVTNALGRYAVPQPWHNQPCHVELSLPPRG